MKKGRHIYFEKRQGWQAGDVVRCKATRGAVDFTIGGHYELIDLVENALGLFNDNQELRSGYGLEFELEEEPLWE